MQEVRQADADRIEVDLFEHLLVIGEEVGDIVFFRLLPGQLGIHIAEGDDLGVGALFVAF